VTDAGAETIREQVAEAAKAQEASQPGSVPAGVVIWANTRGRAPYVPYQALLAARLQGLRRTAVGRGDYTWARLSRRPAPVLRPSGICHPPTVSVIVDTSGSMGSFGETVIGVCHEIVKRSGATVVQCDVNASRHKRKQGFVGGGGTDLRNGFDLAQKDKPDLIVVITDAETPWPAEAPRARTVAVVPHGDPIHGVPAWVDVIRACPERSAKKR
jgi:predicted metal-dependent peptidase